MRAFIWPLVAPPGAGLIIWEPIQGEPWGMVERTIAYEPGNLYVFNGSVTHAWGTWPYRSTYRINLQAFGVRCGETWYLYH